MNYVLETETEVLTGLTTMKNSVTSWTSELYQTLYEHLYLIVAVLVVIILILLIRSLKNKFIAHRNKKKKIMSTNNWFDWAEFYDYEKEKKKK